MQLNKRALSSIGLAMKSGNIASGEFMTEKSVREGRAQLVIVAEDASENTRKKFMNMCEYHHVPIRLFGDKDSLGYAIGKEFRASMAVVDQGLAKLILKNIDSSSN